MTALADSRDLGPLDGPTLIFGGPYSNLAATRAMRAVAGTLGIPPGNVICTGDLVAYCAEPEATLALIRDWGIAVVMGNCEEALGFSAPDCGCGFAADSHCSTLATAWYRYADARVGADHRRWMRGLPRRLRFELAGRAFVVVHGSLDGISEFVFGSSDADAKRRQLDAAGADVIVGGHAGIPFGQPLAGGWWLNAGVIGMPANDGGPHTWYMLLEPGATGIRVDWRRLDYDFRASSRATVRAGMREYGAALRSGLWPSQDILPAFERAQAGRTLAPPAVTI